MVLLTVVFGVGLVCSLLWAWRLYAKDRPQYGNNESHVIFWILAFLFFVGFLVVAGKTVQAKNEAQMFNARYGTEYTTEQVFWARGSIQQILEGSRQRIEGDLNINVQ